MTTIIPDLLRAGVTDIMLVMLLYTMSRPRYSKKHIYICATLLLVVVNILVSTYFYLKNDYTSVARLDFVMLLIIAVALKPLFRETIAQWCFSYITLLNIYVAVVIISYSVCDFFPYPYYANIFLRLVLFATIIFALRKYFLPIYRDVLVRWNSYILMLVGLFINLAYFMVSVDVELMMTDFMWPLLLLILLEILIYVSVFYSMKLMARESTLKEENLKIQSDRDLLHQSTSSMAEHLQLMEESVQQQRIASHDRRHFNSTLLELLEQGQTESASALLKKQLETISKMSKNYCENTAVNAAVCYYATMAQDKGIATDISLDIPKELNVDSLEFTMALSNLLENAVHGCLALPEKDEKKIRFVCHNVGRLVLEISNPCTAETAIGENGRPVVNENAHGTSRAKSNDNSHGIGTKSVLAFASKYGAELVYRIENGVFIVRLIV